MTVFFGLEPLPIRRCDLESMFVGLYVGAKHHDSAAVTLWADRLDEAGASFSSQNLVLEAAESDRSAGVPSALIAQAVSLSRVEVRS